jgi:hypothetical protein
MAESHIFNSIGQRPMKLWMPCHNHYLTGSDPLKIICYPGKAKVIDNKRLDFLGDIIRYIAVYMCLFISPLSGLKGGVKYAACPQNMYTKPNLYLLPDFPRGLL